MSKLLFVDIETFRECDWGSLPSQKREAFLNHHYTDAEDAYTELTVPIENRDSYSQEELVAITQEYNFTEQYNRKAGLIAEFGRVLCISFGAVNKDSEFKVKSLCGLDEKHILSQFAEVLERFEKEDYGIAGWNSNGFDIPYLCKRYLINELHPPIMVNFQGQGLKPWDRLDVDVMNLWKCGGWSNTSLEVACASFNIPVKFTETTGGNLYDREFKDIDFSMLKTYCENDVYSTYLIYQKLDELGYL